MLLEALIKPKFSRLGSVVSWIKGAHASLAEAPWAPYPGIRNGALGNNFLNAKDSSLNVAPETIPIDDNPRSPLYFSTIGLNILARCS